MWIVPVKGTAKALSGDGHVGADGSVQGTLVIDAASINTKNKKRDAHLRTDDFFEVDKYPTLTFTVDGGRLDRSWRGRDHRRFHGARAVTTIDTPGQGERLGHHDNGVNHH